MPFKQREWGNNELRERTEENYQSSQSQNDPATEQYPLVLEW